MSVTQRPIFEIYVEDDRYAVPTLHFVVADDAAGALAIASRLLEENAHHIGAELCLEGRPLIGMGSFARAGRRRGADAAAAFQ